MTCVQDIEEAIKLYHFYNHALKECGELCEFDKDSDKSAVLQKAICDEQCENKLFNGTLNTVSISNEVNEAFKNRIPYTYIQYAYFQMKKVRKAVEATYTYLQHDGDDAAMQDNLDYYKSREDFREDMLVDLEVTPVMEAYQKGSAAYLQGNYQTAIELLEVSVREFYREEGLCRKRCDKSYDAGKEYTEETKYQHDSINDHYRQVLECNLLCVSEVAAVSNKLVLTNFLPELYNYLQFAYYKVGDVEEALRCARSYLLLLPTDEIMKSNLAYYKVDKEIKPRKDVQTFKRRLDLQLGILDFYYKSFGVKDSKIETFVPYWLEADKKKKEEQEAEKEVNVAEINEVNSTPDHEEKKESLDEEIPMNVDDKVAFAEGNLGSYKSWQEKTNDIIESRDISNIRREALKRGEVVTEVETEEEELEPEVELDFETRLSKLNEQITSSTVGRKVIDAPDKITIDNATPQRPTAEGRVPEGWTLLANSSQMGGPHRMAMDGLLDDGQCQTLIDLELSGGTSGDGYYGNKSPHTKHEKFNGLTMYDAIKLSEEGLVPFDAVQLYDRVSKEAMRAIIEYFKLDKQLYFDYTHLVCRTALKQGNSRDDLSHPVHGDNCLLQVDGSCVKERPAYTWRDYSAIVYLNEQFEGGQFVMTDPTARQVKLEVEPKCGRLVSFCAGAECLHGVKPVTRGRRCAVALWFTHDPGHDERRRIKNDLSKAKYFNQLLREEL